MLVIFLVADFNEWDKDHSERLEKVVWICRQENPKLKKGKYLFNCTSIPFFGQILSWQGVTPDLSKMQMLTYLPPPRMKKDLHSFLGVLNHQSRFSSAAGEVCEPLHKVIKRDWTQNRMYQHIYEKAKTIIKRDAYA